jgi:hypothetical protein
MFLGTKATYKTTLVNIIIAGFICAVAENILIWKFNIITSTFYYFIIVADVVFATLFFLPFGKQAEFDKDKKSYLISGLIFTPAVYFLLAIAFTFIYFLIASRGSYYS